MCYMIGKSAVRYSTVKLVTICTAVVRNQWKHVEQSVKLNTLNRIPKNTVKRLRKRVERKDHV